MGDAVRITVDGLTVHGLVELRHQTFLRILEFVRDFWSEAEGADCNVTDWRYSEMDSLEKIKDAAHLLNQARGLDRKFLLRPISTELSLGGNYEIFTYKNDTAALEACDLEKNIYYDDNLWTPVTRLPLIKRNTVKFQVIIFLLWDVRTKGLSVKKS